MKACNILLIVIFLLVFFSTSAMAVDMTQRISFGYNNQLSYGVVGAPNALGSTYLSSQCFSVKYWATREIGIEGLLGFTSTEYEDIGGWGLTLGGKFHYNIIFEKQMNIYTGGGLALIPVHFDDGNDEETNTGINVMAFVGAEFFLDGLPNLAFDFEIGLQYLDFDEYRDFGTYGGGFGTFGIRYYF